MVNEAVAGHGVNQVELRTMDVSFVPQGAAAARHTIAQLPCLQQRKACWVVMRARSVRRMSGTLGRRMCCPTPSLLHMSKGEASCSCSVFLLGGTYNASMPQVDCTTMSTMAANPARSWLFSTAATRGPY